MTALRGKGLCHFGAHIKHIQIKSSASERSCHTAAHGAQANQTNSGWCVFHVSVQ
jgi:hypothetical protein